VKEGGGEAGEREARGSCIGAATWRERGEETGSKVCPPYPPSFVLALLHHHRMEWIPALFVTLS
jgi:hypothetical protein